MRKQNIEKIICTSFPSKTDSMLKFIRALEPEQLEWVGMLMQRARQQGKTEILGAPDALFKS